MQKGKGGLAGRPFPETTDDLLLLLTTLQLRVGFALLCRRLLLGGLLVGRKHGDGRAGKGCGEQHCDELLHSYTPTMVGTTISRQAALLRKAARSLPFRYSICTRFRTGINARRSRKVDATGLGDSLARRQQDLRRQTVVRRRQGCARSRTGGFRTRVG